MVWLGLLAGCFGDGDSDSERAAAAGDVDLVARGEQMFVRLSGERAGKLCAAWTGEDAPVDWRKPGFCRGAERRVRARLCPVPRSHSSRAVRGGLDRERGAGEGLLRSPDRARLGLSSAAPDPRACEGSTRLPTQASPCAAPRYAAPRGASAWSRPRTGAECPGSRWSFTLSGNQNFGVHRCRDADWAAVKLTERFRLSDIIEGS